MAKLLDVKDYKVYYQTLKGQIKAVDGVSFFVNSDEVFGVAGESGCGKSTLGNSLIYLKAPMRYAGGNAVLDGNDISKFTDDQMRRIRFEKISIIPQFAMDAMSPTKKIKNIVVDLVREHNKRMSEKEIIDLTVERFKMIGLSKNVVDMYSIELSGGMKQRVVMVISTLLNPRLLIADEITSALDVSSQKFSVEMLDEFKDKQFVSSVIFITHDISVLYQIADRIMIMYAGHVVEIGNTEDIVSKPLHPYTKLLISSLPKMGIQFSQKRLKGIPGYPPNLLNPPTGCRFYDRCPLRVDPQKCQNEIPPLVEYMPGRYIACWAYTKGNDKNE
ncbi:MAG: ABC transporter ATP-binding protein [Mesoaciditoga sp.]|uniref:ABC transporter ATP-binding protein n=1 Tax=Athalassotoga sp. TaxID=2022597 RepID=UPI000CB8AB56|nr:MAG: ABC transporter ATP-binding protein [Mesoaciditoga sp.]PMP78808.1 MAG: ABC transporter ATP-binding protein [Mesoaciditoga sp.]HEU24051.1 ABC transporter ATP-binding protein [Mesoaciditoga lauensis]